MCPRMLESLSSLTFLMCQTCQILAIKTLRSTTLKSGIDVPPPQKPFFLNAHQDILIVTPPPLTPPRLLVFDQK